MQPSPNAALLLGDTLWHGMDASIDESVATIPTADVDVDADAAVNAANGMTAAMAPDTGSHRIIHIRRSLRFRVIRIQTIVGEIGSGVF